MAKELPGERLARLRKKRGLTQEGLAELLEVSASTVCRKELGKESGGSELNAAELVAYGRALGVDPGWFLRTS